MKKGAPGNIGVAYKPLNKIRIALKGLYSAAILDLSVSYKVVISAAVLLFFAYFNRWVDFSIVLVATSAMVSAEVFNTAIEMLCDFVESQHNEKIGMIKDILAGGVGLAIFTWYVVIALEMYRIYQLLPWFTG